MPSNPEYQGSLLSSHEERLQAVEIGLRSLEVISATTSANLQALMTRVDIGNEHVLERLESLKDNLCARVQEISKSVEIIHKKESKISETWAQIWPKVMVYFLTSVVGAALSLLAHEMVVRPHLK